MCYSRIWDPTTASWAHSPNAWSSGPGTTGRVTMNPPRCHGAGTARDGWAQRAARQGLYPWWERKVLAGVFNSWDRVLLTSSLNSLLVSFLIGSISWTWPAEKPTRRETLSAVAVRWLKSWQVGCVPLYILLSIGLLKSAAWRRERKIHTVNSTLTQANSMSHYLHSVTNLRNKRHLSIILQKHFNIL